MNVLAISAAVTAFLALVLAYSLASWVNKTDEGTERTRELSGYIMEGAVAYLKREYQVMLPVILVLFLIIGAAIDWITGALYLAGVLFSTLAGFFGMRAAVKGSVRTVAAAMHGGPNPALKVAFRSGAVLGLCTAGLVLLGIASIFIAVGVQSAAVITGFCLGTSTSALFGRAAGGIFSKAADVAADLIGKAEKGISMGDPRNPAVIASLTGRFTGGAAGMASDLFESCSGSIISAILIAASTKSITPIFGYPFDLPALEGSVFPLVVSASGILAAMAGIMFVRGNVKQDTTFAVNAGKSLSNVITVILVIIISWVFFGNFNCAFSVVTGMLAGAVIGKITNVYTMGSSRHLKKIADQSPTGYLMVSEYGIGMISTLWPMAVLGAGVLAANAFAGYYGIALAAAGLLSTAGMIAAIDVYAPVSANAVELTRMARISNEAGDVTDKLDLTGKVNAATGKGFSVAASALTVLALFLSFGAITELKAVSLLKPVVIAALIFGAMLPVLLSAVTMNTAGKAASCMIDEVKRQFHSDAGILAGASKPDYGKCVDTGTKMVLKGIVVPGLVSFAAPLFFGIFLGAEALGGMLTGSFLSGVLISLILANTGGSWNHAEKFTAGDPFKDAAGYSITVFMKLTAMVSVIFAPLFLEIGGLL